MSAQTPFPDPIYGLDYLQRVAGGNDALLRKLVFSFLETAPGHAAAIRTALETKDWATLERIAHQLKPSAQAFQIKQMSETINHLRAQFQSGNLVDTELADSAVWICEGLEECITQLRRDFSA